MELAEGSGLTIIAAAIKVTKDEKEFVIAGKRHCNCFETMFLAGVKRPFQEVQGFMTNTFEFVDRKEGWKIAAESGQIKDAEYPRTLFSEDLW